MGDRKLFAPDGLISLHSATLVGRMRFPFLPPLVSYFLSGPCIELFLNRDGDAVICEPRNSSDPSDPYSTDYHHYLYYYCHETYNHCHHSHGHKALFDISRQLETFCLSPAFIVFRYLNANAFFLNNRR